MKILFAASEAVPFIKTGGLADVIGSLPKELTRQGLDVRVILPKYGDIPAKFRDEMLQCYGIRCYSWAGASNISGLICWCMKELPFIS